MQESYRISRLQPKEDSTVDIVVPVPKEVLFGEGERFRRRYLEDGPGADEFNFADLNALAAAFVTLAGWLPITNVGMFGWVCDSGNFGGAKTMREYAKARLGLVDPLPAEEPSYTWAPGSARLD